MSEEKKPTLVLVGTDGNAFSIMAQCRRAARKAKWSPDKVVEMTQNLRSSKNYDDLLVAVMDYFDVC